MPVEPIRGYRLSPQQQHLWLLQQSNQNFYFCAACAVLIEGDLQRGVIEAALQDVVNRHAILRTSFHCSPETAVPLQVVEGKEIAKVDEVNLSEQDPRTHQAEIDKRFDEACRQQVKLDGGPLLKATLIKISSYRHVLIITLPTLCADIAGLNNLVRETARSYSSLLEGKEIGIEPVQYADLSEWQNELLESEETEAGREFWKQKDYSALLTQRPLFEKGRSAPGDFYPVVISSTLSRQLSAKCATTANEYATSEANLLLACWHTLLWVLGGQSQVVVGTVYEGRKYDELKDEIGLLARHLPVQTALKASMPFSHVLRQVDEASRDAYKWQEYFCWERLPFTDQGAATPNFAPFAFESIEATKEFEAQGLKFSIMKQSACADRFEIKLSCARQKENLAIELHFDRNLYSREEIERIEIEFERLLESALNSVESRISELEVISEPERQQIFAKWNKTGAKYEGGEHLHELFEAQASRTPHRVAAVCSSAALSFAELNGRANQLARYLKSVGVGPEVRVGICLHRSLDMVVGLLGILKAGGAYVPLDPTYPKERLAFMAEDSKLAVLLTQQSLLESLPECHGEVLVIEQRREEIGCQSRQDLKQALTGHNLAYVIYTSGSTGNPKGVMIEHRSITNRLLWMHEELPLTARDSLLQKTAASFDASVWEIFLPLMSGARLILAEAEGQQDATYLVEEIKAEQVSVLQVVPTMLEVMLAEAELRSCKSLRRVYCGGEVLTKGLKENFYRQMGAELHNLYGPTEVSIDATHWTCRREESGMVPIGRPIGNVEVYVMNESQRLNPLEVAGELGVGGKGLARGYANRPEVTAEKFVPNPHGEAGSRLYRTGDLARQSSDGVIEYIGRIDHQVKVRGYRIELGEIENALSKHPVVRAATVVAREDETGHMSIVAYVVPKKSTELSTPPQLIEDKFILSTSALRAFMKEKLPDYMVPTAFVILDAFPLTPNGKVDRQALPRLQSVWPEHEGEIVQPRTPTEKVLTAIWAEILRVREVGILDNFFDIGGHSLLATQMMTRVREAFGVDIKLKTLFDGPTVEELCKEIVRKMESGEGPQVPVIRPVARDGNLPLSFAQQRLWFIDQLEPGSALYNVPTVAKITGLLDTNALVAALDEIIRRHESLRTVFAAVGGNPSQVITPPTGIRLKTIDLTGLPEEAKARHAIIIARQEARVGFDLEQGPLVRARLVKLSRTEHIALLTMHHIVSDGWSVGILIRELGTLYESYAKGMQSPLEELETHYVDFAQWQRNWLEGGAMRKQAEYWRQQLEGAPELLELHTDWPRSNIKGYAGSQERFHLSKGMTEGLKELSKREGVTLFMTLLAAFQTLLYRYSNQDDIVVGTDIASRHWAKTEGLIGFFGNQLVLRADLSGNPTFCELLGRVKEVTLGAYAHQDMPFGKLVELLNPDRRTGRTPLFQVKMVLQNAPTETLTLQDLALELIEDDDRIGLSRFDLLLTFAESEQALTGVIEYSQDLFKRTTIARIIRNLEKLLESILAQPEARLNSLEILTEAEIRERAMQKKKRQESSFEKFRSTTPKKLNLSPQEFIKLSSLRAEDMPPLVIEPDREGIDLAEWLRFNLSFIEKKLSDHGAILFRNFNILHQSRFEEFLGATACQMMTYTEGATPRTRLSEKVYTSTEYPADQYIALHNELTYVTNWPMKIYFFCMQPALEGGETPIADVRRVYNRIDPRIRERFIERGWMLVRNFGQGLSLPWQTSFHTSDKSEAETYFRGARIDWEWKAGGGLRTRQVRPAVAKHPRTLEMVWFNHVAFWHLSSLEPKVRESMLAMFAEEDLPYNTYYGDGSPIEDSVVEEIREAYRLERQVYAWRAGDILMLDNMLVAHGRNPYSGPRKVLVAMGEASNITA